MNLADWYFVSLFLLIAFMAFLILIMTLRAYVIPKNKKRW